MARPSRADARELAALEGAAGGLYQAARAVEIAALRVRQIGRRAPGLVEHVERIELELETAQDRLSSTRELLFGVLGDRQERRQRENG